MRVLFISSIEIDPTYSSLCLGLGYLSSYLRRQGHTTRIIEPRLLPRGVPASIAKDFQPDVIGINVWCLGYRQAIRYAQRMATEFPQAIRIAGGPLASFIPDELLVEDLFHYVITGPGEIALSQLLEALSHGDEKRAHNIHGVYYRDHTKGEELGRPLTCIEHLDYPDRDPDSHYAFPNALMMNRGCNQRCIFCVNPTLAGLQVRTVDSVMKEIAYLIETSGPSTVVFADDNLAIKKSQVKELCDRLSKIENVSWVAHTRADVDRRVLEQMCASGCIRIGMGVESGNETVLKKIRKGLTLEQVEQTVKTAHANGVRVTLYYILGHFCDTPDTMQDTIDHGRQMSIHYGAEIRVSCNTLYPGSPQYVMRDQLGLKTHAKTWDQYVVTCPTISGQHFTLEDLQEKYYSVFP